MDVDVALVSLTVPCVGAMTVSELTCTRMPSNLSRLFMSFTSVSGAVSVIGAGSELPVVLSDTVGEPAISVDDGLLGSDEGMNSCTNPVTVTRLPTVAAEVGALEVKTKIPSDVFGLASMSASGV